VTTEPSLLEARRRVLPSQTARISTALGTAFVTLTRDPDEEPFEVFLNVGKAGSETFASAEALGRLISLALRLDSPIYRSERVRDIAGQLEHIGSTTSGASQPSIPDALAEVLRESLTESSSDVQLNTSTSRVVQTEARPKKSLPWSPTARPPTISLSNPLWLPKAQPLMKGNKRKKTMNTNFPLPDDILTTAEQLAAAILRATPIAAFQQAKARLDADAHARELLERFSRTQAELRVRQSRNVITQADVDQLRTLQREVQSNQRIMDYAETQQAAIAYLPAVNQEISQLLGVDFASLAGPASC